MSNTDLTPEQCKTLNSLLPPSFHKDKWASSDFYGNLRRDVKNYLTDLRSDIPKWEYDLTKKDSEKEEILDKHKSKMSSAIKVYNVNLSDAKPLGMVDVGLVKTFSSASSGNRLEAGALQLVIEQAFDEGWKTNNSQMKAVNEVKLELLRKCLDIFPDCDSLINFEVDFREMGSSGNVFVYMRGTAAITGNKTLDKVKKELKPKLDALYKKFEVDIPNEIQKIKDLLNTFSVKEKLELIPRNFRDAKKLT